MTVQSLRDTTLRIRNSKNAPLLVTVVRGTDGQVNFDSCPSDTAYAAKKISSKSEDIVGVFRGVSGSQKFYDAAEKLQ